MYITSESICSQNGRPVIQKLHGCRIQKPKKSQSDAAKTSVAPGAVPGGEQFQSLVESASSGILVHRHLQPLYVNPALVKLFGYDSAEEIFALESVAELYASEFRERLKDYHEARLIGGDAPADYRLKGLRRDGSEVWLKNRPVRIDWHGGPAICTTLIDITERVMAEEQHLESEARFRDFARVASDWFWEMDADLRFTFFPSITAR
jgi:PAS domain S-box-containing protein